MGKLSKLRNGEQIHSFVTIDNLKMAVVVLPSDTIRQIEEETTKHMSEIEIESASSVIRNLFFDQLLCFHSLRDPENLDVKMADNIKDCRKS